MLPIDDVVEPVLDCISSGKESDDAGSGSDSSSDNSDVGSAIVAAEPKVEAHAVDEHHSDDEMEELVPDAVVAVHVPIAIPDPVVALEPLYDLGVQKVGVAPTGKAPCQFCILVIPKSAARLVFHPSKKRRSLCPSFVYGQRVRRFATALKGDVRLSKFCRCRAACAGNQSWYC